MGSDSSCVRRGPRQGRRDRQPNSVSDLSQTPRLRSLATFLGCDARSVADGIIEAARRDPTLRLQRI